jgi:hypothetical protein
MWAQWCLLIGVGLPAADGDLVGAADEVEDEDVDVVRADVMLEPPVDASATPVPAAPSPAATTPVMMSRRVRPPDLETIGVPPFSTAAADRVWLVVRDQPARAFC